jgi:hypothetical protein
MVRMIKQSIHLAPLEMWTRLEDEDIFGVGPNVKTEVLMTFDYKHFPNLNKNPLRVLEDIGCKLKTPQSFKPIDYQNYTNLIQEIATEIGLKNMLEVDSFFNNVYWKIKNS